jgi:photosystem II PsbU protein
MVKRMLNLCLSLGLILSVWLGSGVWQSAQAATVFNRSFTLSYPLSEILRNPIDEKLGEVGSKVDLNNSNVMAFRKYPGLYPTLARKIIQNAPFDTVEAVLEIPGLSERELDVLKANLDNFVVTPTEPALTEGADRINPGVYK